MLAVRLTGSVEHNEAKAIESVDESRQLYDYIATTCGKLFSDRELSPELQALTPANAQGLLHISRSGAARIDGHDDDALRELTPRARLALVEKVTSGAVMLKTRRVSLSAVAADLAARPQETPFKLRILEAALRGDESFGRWSWIIKAGAPALHFGWNKTAKEIIAAGVRLSSSHKAEAHMQLKNLLDTYHLRIDNFDRVENEPLYLQRMAKIPPGVDDKEWMVGHVRPGNIIEVGPAGCAVLRLLQPLTSDEAPTKSTLYGLDISRKALDALETQRQDERLSFALIEGNALDMQSVCKKHGIAGVDTVIFCSVLHEVFSYTEVDGKAYHLSTVRQALDEALAVLRPGGRIIIRDWVIPRDANAPRTLVLKTERARDYFESFARDFTAFEVGATLQQVGDTQHVTLPARAAMELMYKMSWGPESFPYEVREQYGVFTEDEYKSELEQLAAKQGVGLKVCFQQSYLQVGYRQHLEQHIELHNVDGTAAEWPPSKMLLVVEKAHDELVEGRPST